MKRFFTILAAALLLLSSCSKPQEKRLYIWVDAMANFPDFANSKENIRRDLTLAKEAGFTDVVVDIRPTCGDVLYRSETGHQVEWLGAVMDGKWSRCYRTADWDYLGAFSEIGHELGLRVHAGFNTFMAGDEDSLGINGLLFRDADKRDWATCYSLKDGIHNALDCKMFAFFNPANPEVQQYLLKLIEELAAYKDLDGIVLDRCRYAGIASHFSELTKKQFLEYANLASIRWPEDILPHGADYYTAIEAKNQGPYYKLWLEFRVKTIHDFVQRASEAVHAVNPDIKFGCYVGGCYSQYFE